MQTVKLGGENWVVDLDWEIVPVEDDMSRREVIKNIAKKTGYSYGIFIEYGDQEAVGLSKKSTKTPSASYRLALANQEMRGDSMGDTAHPDWIVIEAVGDDKYWFGVVKDGVPSPQYDSILTITEVKEHVNDILEGPDTYRIFSPNGEIVALLEGLKEIETKSINDLTADINAKNKFEKISGVPVGLLYGVAGVVVLGAAGVAVQSFLESSYIKQKEQERLFAEQQLKEQREAEYKQKLEEYNKELEKRIKEAKEIVLKGLAGEPNKILKAWYSALGDMRTPTHGWEADKNTCSFDLDNSPHKSVCTFTFNRTGLSTNRMLLQEMPDAVIAGNTATVTRGVVTDENIYTVPPEAILSVLPTAKNWGFDMISQLQLMKLIDVDFQITDSEEITFTPPIKPLSPEEQDQGMQEVAPVPTSLGIGVGKLIIKSNNFDLLREIANNVDFEFVGIKSMNFRVDKLGDIPWELEAEYYIKTSEGGMVGSDTAGVSATSVPQLNSQDGFNGNNGGYEPQR